MTTINLDGVVGWDIDAKEFASVLDQTTGDIEFELNSGGGYVTDGVSILNKIRSYNRGKTTAKISYAASMMTQIALACDEVKVYDNAIFMIHNVQGVVMGDHNDMREAADLQERMSDMLAQMYCKKTKKPKEEIKAMMDADTYVFGQEIKDMGFADEVIDTDTQDKSMAMVNADSLNKKAYKAMKEEKLSVSDLKENFKSCMGNCTLQDEKVAVVPDASVPKTAKKTIGADMEFKFDKENLETTEATFNALVANRETLTSRNSSLELQLQTSETALATAKEELSALKADMTSKVSEAEENLKNHKEMVETRLKEAIAASVDLKTAMAMVNAESEDEASKLALEAKSNTEALPQGEGSGKEQSKLLAYAAANKGRIK